MRASFLGLFLVALAACNSSDDSTGSTGGGSENQAGSGGAAGSEGGAGQGGQGGGVGATCAAPGCVMTGVNAGVLAVAIDGQQRPLVMTTREVKTNDDLTNVEVRRLEGSSWVLLGEALTGVTFTLGGAPLLWVDAQDNPTVAYAVQGPTDHPVEVRVVQIQQGAWAQLGDLIPASHVIGLGGSSTGSAVVPAVIGSDGSSDNTRFLYNAATKAWVPVPGATSLGKSIAGPIGGDEAIVAQDATSGAIQLYLAALPGWKAAGPVLATDPDLHPLALVPAANSGAAVLLARTLDSGSSDLSVRVLEGASWSDKGSVNGTLATRGGSLGGDGGTLIAAFLEKSASITGKDTVHVRHLDGAAWADLTTVSDDTTVLAETPAVAVKGKAGAVTWASPSASNDYGVYYRALAVP
jgi:hypothetical protein